MKSAVIVGALITALSATAAQAVDFNYTGSTVVWDAPADGVYKITVWGASGGLGDPTVYGDPNPNLFRPGRGVRLSGLFTLSKGAALSVSVGGAGQNGKFCCNSGFFAGGGGGGSFVVANGSPLIIGGGGGGGGGLGMEDGVSENGGDANFGPAGGGSAAGPVGYGGGAGDGYGGGGGGGFYGDGQSSFDSDYLLAGGGGGYPGLAGGNPNLFDGMASGGFGGGGAGGLCGGGGGGGYSGGGGGDCTTDDYGGGGGGSFDTGGQPRFLGYGAPYQDGLVMIQSVPEPSTWAVILLGFGLAGLALRRRGSVRV